MGDGNSAATTLGNLRFDDAEKFRFAGPWEILERVRSVRDGNLVASAAVLAGFDRALWRVGQIYGVAHARRMQDCVEYDPSPPYGADA